MKINFKFTILIMFFLYFCLYLEISASHKEENNIKIKNRIIKLLAEYVLLSEKRHLKDNLIGKNEIFEDYKHTNSVI